MFSEEITGMPSVSSVEAYLWEQLALEGKHDIIEVLHRADKGEIHKIRLKEGRKFSSSDVIHGTVVKFLELRKVEIVS